MEFNELKTLVAKKIKEYPEYKDRALKELRRAKWLLKDGVNLADEILNSEKNEHNAYHIDGDADDENTAANTDKLMAAIVADPDGMTQFFQKLTSDLYENLGKNMTSTTLRSYGKFYNDKELDKQYSNYSKLISQWEEKVSDKEEYYYKQFTAMESALAKLNSQQSSLSGLLGGS